MFRTLLLTSLVFFLETAQANGCLDDLLQDKSVLNFRVQPSLVSEHSKRWKHFEKYIWSRFAQSFSYEDRNGPPSQQLVTQRLLRRLARTHQFNEYLESFAQKIVEPSECLESCQYSRAKHFLFDYLDQVQDLELSALQDHYLRKSLIAKGHKVALGRSGYEGLKTISQRNVSRVLGGRFYSQGQLDRHIEQAVYELPVRFVHRSNHLREAPVFHLFAPVVIDRLGLRNQRGLVDPSGREVRRESGFGAFSRRPYHRFLGSTNNVYFSVRYSGVFEQGNVYGKHAYVVDKEYAEKVGWVSAWVMERSNMFERLEEAGVPTSRAQSLQDFLDVTAGLESNDRHERIRAAKLLRSYFEPLTNYDFRASDFTLMVKELVLLELTRLKNHSPEKFVEATSAFLKRDHDFVDRFIKNTLVINSLPAQFEFKVPFMAEKSKIDAQNREN